MSKLSQRLGMGAVVVAALAAGLVFGTMVRDDASGRAVHEAATGLERYEIGGDFELTNQRGERMRLSDLKGRALVMFFGYTFCPDVCPATLARMREVRTQSVRGPLPVRMTNRVGRLRPCRSPSLLRIAPLVRTVFGPVRAEAEGCRSA